MSVTDENMTMPRFTRKWRKYYLADEVDHYLLDVSDDLEQKAAKLDEYQEKYNEISDEHTEKATENEALRQANRQQETLIAEQVREISSLGSQIMNFRGENTKLAEHIAQQDMELARMQKRIDTMNGQLAHMEKQTGEEVVQQAVRKAEQIIREANEDSNRIMLQATEQRGRLMSACRAAYYSALQFKKDLADQFRSMEKELDASIDILQLMDNSRLALNHTAEAAEPSGEDENTVLP
ncbi:MAG: DivIVA domain-containing protein [Eubacteriales bacterium]|nr:DivIVA domain-containing protein [Eubacteriales bacterium]